MCFTRDGGWVPLSLYLTLTYPYSGDMLCICLLAVDSCKVGSNVSTSSPPDSFGDSSILLRVFHHLTLRIINATTVSPFPFFGFLHYHSYAHYNPIRHLHTCSHQHHISNSNAKTYAQRKASHRINQITIKNIQCKPFSSSTHSL